MLFLLSILLVEKLSENEVNGEALDQQAQTSVVNNKYFTVKDPGKTHWKDFEFQGVSLPGTSICTTYTFEAYVEPNQSVLSFNENIKPTLFNIYNNLVNGICHDSLGGQTAIDSDQLRAKSLLYTCKKEDKGLAFCITPDGEKINSGESKIIATSCESISSNGEVGSLSFNFSVNSARE